jgi:hypothetical protein
MHINGKSANANVAMYVLHILHNSKVIPQDMNHILQSKAKLQISDYAKLQISDYMASVRY